jgi:hypothetical protein
MGEIAGFSFTAPVLKEGALADARVPRYTCIIHGFIHRRPYDLLAD